MTVLKEIPNGARGVDVRDTMNDVIKRPRPTRVRVVSPFGSNPVQNVQFSTPNPSAPTSGTDKLVFGINAEATSLQFVMLGGAPVSGSGAILRVGNPVNFKMTLEVSALAPFPISFPSTNGAPVSAGGLMANVLGDGEFLVSNPTPITPSRGYFTKADAALGLRLYKAVGATQRWPMTYGVGSQPAAARSTDMVYGGTDKTGSDQTYQGSPTWAAPSSPQYALAPIAVLGETADVSVGITGNSIANGFGAVTGKGYIGVALDDASICYHNTGVNSLRSDNLVYDHQIAKFLSRYYDVIIPEFMRNDYANATVTTLAQAKAQFLKVVKALGHSHTKFILPTTFPSVTTTNSGATYDQQTKYAWEDLRVQVNNWIRDTGPTGAMAELNAQMTLGKVVGTFDPAILVERNADGSQVALVNGQQTLGTGGYWLLNMSTDGTHPNNAACAIAKASVPIGLITVS